jgi:hypothetical protein
MPRSQRYRLLIAIITLAYLGLRCILNQLPGESLHYSAVTSLNPEAAYASGVPLPLSCISEIDLERIKGIGSVTAQAIKGIRYEYQTRTPNEENTYFSTQLLAIKGIGQKRLHLLQEFLKPPEPEETTSKNQVICDRNKYLPFEPRE